MKRQEAQDASLAGAVGWFDPFVAERPSLVLWTADANAKRPLGVERENFGTAITVRIQGPR